MLDRTASNSAADAATAPTCERCGDYAPLVSLGSRRLCKACVARLPIAQSGMSVGTSLRETLWVTKQLFPAVGVFWLFHLAGQLFNSLLMWPLAALVSPQAMLALGPLGTSLFFGPALGFVVVCTTDRIAGAERPLELALGTTLRTWRPLVAIALLIQGPQLLRALVDMDSTASFTLVVAVANLLSSIVALLAFYAPALIVNERLGALAALRTSITLLGHSFATTLLCSLVLRLPLMLLQQLPYAMLLAFAAPGQFAVLNGIAIALFFPLYFPHAALRGVLWFKLRRPG